MISVQANKDAKPLVIQEAEWLLPIQNCEIQILVKGGSANKINPGSVPNDVSNL